MDSIVYRTKLLLILISIKDSFCAVTSSPANVSITTNNGVLQGARKQLGGGDALEIFLGVPYASPPVGRLRWSSPQPRANWTGQRSAFTHGNRCLERVIPEDPITPKLTYSEDCLYLDVYSYRSTDRLKLVPTMMFIHGGGWYGGTGALYNFTNVALRKVVVVTINYRLDVFGFLSNNNTEIPGNYGILDQVFALSWVQENIRRFGGNPDDITFFGGSAGAASVALMMLSPLTRGHFHKAILQSGAATSVFATTPPTVKTRDLVATLAKLTGCDQDPNDLLDCLRAAPAEAIINASVAMQTSFGSSLWFPVVETVHGFLPAPPATLLADEHSLVPIPAIWGYNHDDMASAVSDPDDDGLTHLEFIGTLNSLANRAYPENQDNVVRAIVKQYLKKEPRLVDKITLRATLVKILTDMVFVAPAIQEAKAFGRACGIDWAGTEQFLYDFSHRPSFSQYSEWIGVNHADEKGFVLGLPEGPDPFAYPYADATDKRVSELVVDMWTNFAKQGFPSSKHSNVTWPPYARASQCGGGANPSVGGANKFVGVSSGQVFVLSNESHSKPFDRNERVEFWTKTIPEIISKSQPSSAEIPGNNFAILCIGVFMSGFIL